MKTEATVISISGDYAMVESHRKSACDGCHKMAEGGCSICSLTGSDATIKLRVRNKLGAKVGDRVTVSTETGRVLGYAWLVFLMPVIVAGLFYAGANMLFADELYSVIAAVGGMVISFVALAIYSRVRVSRRCDAEIVDIIK